MRECSSHESDITREREIKNEKGTHERTNVINVAAAAGAAHLALEFARVAELIKFLRGNEKRVDRLFWRSVGIRGLERKEVWGAEECAA